MPIYADSGAELFEQYKLANEQEGAAIRALSEFAKSGSSDMAIALELTQKMEEAHQHAMDIYDQLQAHRLDK